MPKWDSRGECIGEIRALKRQSATEDAQHLLEKVYRYVLPIMRKRSMRVHKLVEFLPRSQELLGLNVNHGQSISIRLRYHHAPDQFLPFESVLGTMLHELCHNVIGPHNQRFFAMLDELTQEMEGMIAIGFTGDMFFGSGHRLGTVPRRLTPSVPWAGLRGNRTRALGRLAGPGFRLGGAPGPRRRDDVRVKALEAAERRLQANVLCGSNRRLAIDDLGYEEISRDEYLKITRKSRDSSTSPSPSSSMASPTSQAQPPSSSNPSQILPPQIEVIDLTHE